MQRLSYLNNVQHNVLVEAIQDALGNAVVIPSTVNQQKILQVLELKERREDRDKFIKACRLHKISPANTESGFGFENKETILSMLGNRKPGVAGTKPTLIPENSSNNLSCKTLLVVEKQGKREKLLQLYKENTFFKFFGLLH